MCSFRVLPRTQAHRVCHKIGGHAARCIHVRKVKLAALWNGGPMNEWASN